MAESAISVLESRRERHSCHETSKHPCHGVWRRKPPIRNTQTSSLHKPTEDLALPAFQASASHQRMNTDAQCPRESFRPSCSSGRRPDSDQSMLSNVLTMPYPPERGDMQKASKQASRYFLHHEFPNSCLCSQIWGTRRRSPRSNGCRSTGILSMICRDRILV